MSSMLHVRMDDDLKERGNEALAAMGLTAAEAVRILYHRIVTDQAFPLELKVPNSDTRAAMAEAEEIIRGRKARFSNAEELIEQIEK